MSPRVRARRSLPVPRLLVTYDGSRASRAAFAPAERLALQLGAELILLRVHNPRLEDEQLGEARLLEIEKRWRSDLRRIGSRMRCGTDALVQRLRGKRWRVDIEILATADEVGADAIVMATQGVGKARHFFLGSVALDVVARSPRPVVLVSSRVESDIRTKGARRKGIRILATMDGSLASRAIAAPAASLVRRTGGELLVLRVHHPAQPILKWKGDSAARGAALDAVERSMREELARAIGRLGCKARPVVRRVGEGNSAADEILLGAEKYDVDLIALSTRGWSGLRHLLIGSTALEVIRKSRHPVMVVRPRLA